MTELDLNGYRAFINATSLDGLRQDMRDVIDYAKELERENRRLSKFMSLRVGPERPPMTELERYYGEGQAVVDAYLPETVTRNGSSDSTNNG